jgi:hypothetical protein
MKKVRISFVAIALMIAVSASAYFSAFKVISKPDNVNRTQAVLNAGGLAPYKQIHCVPPTTVTCLVVTNEDGSTQTIPGTFLP